MVKRALLVGCNYPQTKHQLNGCVNDVKATRDMLLQLGFDESDIRQLIDTDPSGEQPTGINMKNRLAEMVALSQPGDVLFFHYSGHGTQVLSPDGEESDGKDEALCPTDMNLITDDDLRQILAKLPDGVKFTMVADCCHSGTLLDQPTVEISGPKSDDPDPPAMLADTFSATAGAKEARSISCRNLPIESVASDLGERLGVDVEPTQVRAAMVAAFGTDASAKLTPLISSFERRASCNLDELIPGAVGDLAGGLLGGLVGVLSSEASGEVSGQSVDKGLGNTLFSLALDLLKDPEVKQQMPTAGVKPAPEAQIPDGRVVLVTGCQANETSADACPSGDPAQAFGALTNALTTVMKQFTAAYPDKPISARTLVVNVRDSLDKAGFAQNPCLECDDAAADSGFIVG